MNIVYIVGNGFDRNLGLKTSYQDFYKFYKAQVSPNEEVKKVKQLIANEPSELWSDLELALGRITSGFNNVNEYVEVLKDISDNLRKYIKEESNRLIIKPVASERMRQYLSAPFDCLTPEVKRQAESHFNAELSREWYVNIISFNYSYVLEWLLSDFIGKRIGSHHQNNAVVNLHKIHHIHGKCDSSILVGVNDLSQIANESFRTDEYLLDWLMKPRTQTCLSDGVERECKTLINNADLICLFGMSFGATDNMWWRLIQDRLRANAYYRALIYDYVPNVSFADNREQERGLYRREAKRRLAQSRYDSLQNSILCDTNTKMFDFHEVISRGYEPYDIVIPKAV